MAIDLEHFPTNETAIRMMERISPIYDRSYVGKWIFEVMGMEMGEARAYFEELRQQPFPERTTWAIEYWERRYAIIPKPTDDLENRRRNIIMKRGARLPMNPAMLERILRDLTGGNTRVTENVDDYTFSVEIENPRPFMDTSGVIREIKRRKPSHQNFKFSIIFRSKEPATFYVGGSMGSSVAFGIPMEPDRLDFQTTLHAGGAFAGQAVLPVPEDITQPSATTILRTGGVCTIISNLSGGE